MSETLLTTFMREACTPHVRSLLHATIARFDAKQPPFGQHFEFNRFELTLDAERGEVLIEDDLNATESGTQRLPVNELRTALAHTAE